MPIFWHHNDVARDDVTRARDVIDLVSYLIKFLPMTFVPLRDVI